MNLSNVYADDTFQFIDGSLAYCTVSSDGTITATSDALHQRVYDLISPSGTYSGTFTLTNPDALNDIYFYRSGNICNKNSAIGTSFSISSIVYIKCSNSNGSTCNLFDAFTFSPDINNPNPQPEPIKSKYQIQNGWLTVIDLGNSGTSYDYDLSTMFNVNSGLISQNWTETSQLYWFSNTLPSAGDTYENIGTLIQWERGEPRNIFGQTKYGICNLSGTSSGRYLYILNPFYRAIADNEHPTIVNYPVTVDGLLEGQQAYIYEVTATATITGIVNSITTTTVDGVSTITNWGTTSGGSISADVTNTFVNSDTDTSTIQTSGGGNSNETAQTINDYLQQIQDVLDSFVTQVLGLLTAPISHIRQLITTGSEFMSTLGGLFTWLPEPVISVVVSALIVMVVIGIFKMFL